MITNNANLPKAIVDAIKTQRDEYSGGGSFLSASGVTKSPRIFWLEKRHEVDTDASDMIWSLLGTAVHNILESAAKQGRVEKVEERLYKEVLGVKFSGQYDNLGLADKILSDFKVTSVWSVLGNAKPEWVAQLNCLRLLLIESGQEVEKLQIVAILRDWSKGKSLQGGNYPKRQVKRINIPVWPLEETQRYLEERIQEFLNHKDTQDDDLPPCTDEDKWTRPSKYAVMKKGNKRAVRLFEDILEAESLIEEKGGEPQFYLEERKGEDVRCVSYCSVCEYCNYWQENYKEEK